MKNILKVIALIFLLLGIFFGIYYFAGKDMSGLEQIPTEDPISEEPPVEDPVVEKPISDTILPKFEEYYIKNDDIVGWVNVPNTLLDYPVMQAEDNDFYLHRDFDKNYLFDGIPFMDFRNDLKPDLDTNTLVYGHNMGIKGNIFTELMRYQNVEFYKKSPIVNFDTLYQENQWKVIAVFDANTEAQFGAVFEYYNFVEPENEEEFNWYITEINRRSFYFPDVDVKYGDKLLTLQTCVNDKFETKLVVVARRLRAGEEPTVNVENVKINENRVLPRQS